MTCPYYGGGVDIGLCGQLSLIINVRFIGHYRRTYDNRRTLFLFFLFFIVVVRNKIRRLGFFFDGVAVYNGRTVFVCRRSHGLNGIRQRIQIFVVFRRHDLYIGAAVFRIVAVLFALVRICTVNLFIYALLS